MNFPLHSILGSSVDSHQKMYGDTNLMNTIMISSDKVYLRLCFSPDSRKRKFCPKALLPTELEYTVVQAVVVSSECWCALGVRCLIAHKYASGKSTELGEMKRLVDAGHNNGDNRQE